MNVVCRDFQESSSSIDGIELTQPGEVHGFFAQLQGRKPFLFELTAESGYKLIVGCSEDCGCIQFSLADGEPPYLMALAEDGAEPDTFVEFLNPYSPSRGASCLLS